MGAFSDRIRTLLVDDDPVALAATSKALSEGSARPGQRDIEVRACPSEGEALVALEEEVVDVIVLNVELSEPSGVELLDKLRSACPSSEVIIIAAALSVEGAVEAARQGANEVITKPVQIEDLRRRIRTAYQQARRRITAARRRRHGGYR